jgi:2-polyprenyl-3-methyl-5-hydroxy-6-metoxy-1,4-benzoquinol methylase
MRPVVQDFVRRALFAESMAGARVLEIGSYDVNGSVRPHIESLGVAEYLGVDMQAGPGVDVVWNCEHLDEMSGATWDLVVSTEMLEHAEHWRECMSQMAKAVRPGGLLLLTTVSPGFGYHPFPSDYWRFTVADLTRIMDALGMEVVVAEESPPGERFPQFGTFIMARKPSEPLPQKSLEDIVVSGVT